jgi:DNA-binding response OmpR family regulator
MSKSQKPVVLVADDEPSTLAVLAAHLTAKGYRVLEASDGDHAWELAHEHLPDLVVLDVMMPGMSGWEVCRKVREAVSLAHTGVVMLTGIGENLNQMTSPLYGADAYVDKPFQFSELDRKIEQTLARRREGTLGRPDHADVEPRDEQGLDQEDDRDDDDDDDENVVHTSAPDIATMDELPTRPPKAARGAKRAAAQPAKPARAKRTTRKAKRQAPSKKAKRKPAKAAAKRAGKPVARKAKKGAKKAPAKKTAVGKAKKSSKKGSAKKKAPAKKAPSKKKAPAKKPKGPKKAPAKQPAAPKKAPRKAPASPAKAPAKHRKPKRIEAPGASPANTAAS